MNEHRIYGMPFARVYPLYLQKAERKQRTREEVDRVICWLTGYSPKELQKRVKDEVDFRTFFGEAPNLHPQAALVKGTICGVRIEQIEDPLMRNIRILDRLVDELARGRPLEKILNRA